VQKHLQSMNHSTMSIVRVPCNEDAWIKRILDTGCNGLMIPMVLTAEDARRAVNSAFYPPRGARSVGLSRAHKYGLGFNDYILNANDKLTLLIQVEHIEAVNNLDEILEVEGISGIFIGPYDLSASLGMTGEVDSERVQAEIRIIKTKCKEAGIPWGIFGMTPGSIKKEIEEGCTFALCGIDSVFLSQQAQFIIAELKKVSSASA